MPPRKNVAPSNAVRQFWCDICSKGYPRQPDYENHLRSYDHNHRQRLADMKKLTARNEAESKPEKKRDGELKSIPVQSGLAGKGFTKVGGGGGFTKIGAGTGGGFKKVGTVVGGGNADSKKEEETKLERMMREQEDLQRRIDALKAVETSKQGTESPKPDQSASQKDTLAERKTDKDIKMGGTEEDERGWEEYDFTKPTGCDHANCRGCKVEGIWDDDFEPIAI